MHNTGVLLSHCIYSKVCLRIWGTQGAGAAPTCFFISADHCFGQNVSGAPSRAPLPHPQKLNASTQARSTMRTGRRTNMSQQGDERSNCYIAATLQIQQGLPPKAEHRSETSQRRPHKFVLPRANALNYTCAMRLPICAPRKT